ncbi:MAG: hypothetical protein HYR70_08140 [Chloroflexi bacterium]|nr:hypothetical protein [Chloroflexota bacterium]MBI3339200.1 hypothetical protein [Chloroflexota bacterium]
MSNKPAKTSKKPAKISKKPEKISKKPEKKKQKDWPVVVYIWAFGLGFLSYLVAEAVFRTSQPHPIHWLSGLVGGIVGIGIGWLWFRWRGDVF